VLVVDDSALARVAISRALRARGLEVRAFGSMKELRAVELGGYAAALLDLELDDALGTEIASLLHEHAPTMPIAFLTAGGSADLLAAARAIGPVFFKTTELERAASWIATAARSSGA